MAKRNESEATKAVFRQYMGRGDRQPSRYKNPTKEGIQAGKKRKEVEDYLEEKKLKQQLSDDFYGQYEELLDD